MNAMLKGQMLATSLDAFFSDPALGGNRISAPAPIGGVDVDVSNICSPDKRLTSFVLRLIPGRREGVRAV